MRIVVTGAGGLIGRHAHIRLHAQNCAAKFRGDPEPWTIAALDRSGFQDDQRLANALAGADAVLHFAGVNRAPDAEVEAANPAIAERLSKAIRIAGVDPVLVHANSVHAGGNTPYGRSKAKAAQILGGAVSRMADLVLPHIFGEGARPDYNNVTATLIDRILRGQRPELNPHGQVHLLHAGAAADLAIDAVRAGTHGRIEPAARSMTVPDLWEQLQVFHVEYGRNVFPDLSDPFDLALFNSYRAAIPSGPRALTLHEDARGTLFEAVKGGGGGQSFVSTTKPGVTRGDHFHLGKVERFLVITGEAVIRIRPVLTDEVRSIRVSGTAPAAVDIPTLATHSLENVGQGDLTTMFWTHEIYDPAFPDTFADKVLP